MNNPTYYAILSADVRYCPDLSPQEKLLFAEITALSNKDGFCIAGNPYFSKLYNLSESTISRQVKHLEDLGFIKVTYDKIGAKIARRYISTTSSTIDKNVNGKAFTVDENVNRTIDKNRKENNTSNINITRLNNIDDKSVQLLNMFIAGLKRRNPKVDRNDKQKAHYLEVFDSMLETYSYTELASMITFTFNHNFWSGIILSADKLKQHHEQLYTQSRKKYAIVEDMTDDKVDF